MKNFKILFNLFLLMGLIVSLSSCLSEDPFKISDNDNLVKFNLTIDQNLTRAQQESSQALLDDCVVYISDEGGLLHKWKGIGNIPTQGVYLKYGDYLAEAWAGDSVPASFDSKFFKGETRFSIGKENVTTQVSIACKLANVVTSIDVASCPQYLLKDLKVIFENAQNELEFTGENLYNKGYFMRPYDKETEEFDSKFNYTVSGTDIDGSEFSLSGIITNALPGHEYRLFLENNGSSGDIGGVNLTLSIREYELAQDDEVVIFSAPQFAWEGSDVNVENQLTRGNDGFVSKSLLIAACDGFRQLTLSTSDPEIQKNFNGNSEIEIIGISSAGISGLQSKGIDIVKSETGNRIKGYKLTFNTSWFGSLPESDQPYKFDVVAVDASGKKNGVKISILNMKAPFLIVSEEWKNDLLSISAKEAEITVSILEKVENIKLQYRLKDTEEWQSKEISATRAEENLKIKINNLQPGKTYECRLVGGEFDGESYTFVSPMGTFTTESIFEIPNSNMEDWSQGESEIAEKPIWFPSANGKLDYWDCGNHGSITLDVNLTEGENFMAEHGKSAKLTSKYVALNLLGVKIGKHGAGNIFTGKYAGTDGTDGIIELGREYNGSHPKALKVMVNYRPQQPKESSQKKNGYIEDGEWDLGQIYVALSSSIHTANTKNASTLVVEDKLPSEFIAYGQKTFGDKKSGEGFGADGTLQEVIIPLEYFNSAHTIAPKYLIIVCSASKYGDYFSGGEGSTMYVDDFELLYE